MSGQPGPDFGPQPRAVPLGAPFSVTGPTSITLSRERRGVASFVVTNLSGRDVIARLLPQGIDATPAQWLSIAGPIERPLGVDATLTAEVHVAAPQDAPAGAHALRLDVAIEDAPDRVTTGQAVSFAVPEADRRRFPWWIVAVAVGALAVIAGGVLAINAWRSPADPVLVTEPDIQGDATIGSELTVVPGTWDPADAVLFYRWQTCPPDADDADPQGCTDITVAGDGESSTASGPGYVIGADLEGVRIRVVELAVGGDPSTEGADVTLDDLPKATAASPMTEVVPPAPPETVPVPAVIGLTVADAQDALAAAGLQMLLTRVGSGGVCDPPVEAQNPAPDEQVELGATVAVTTLVPPPLVQCWDFDFDREIPDFQWIAPPEFSFP